MLLQMHAHENITRAYVSHLDGGLSFFHVFEGCSLCILEGFFVSLREVEAFCTVLTKFSQPPPL